MTDIERIEQRLAAVERTVVDGDHELNDLAELADLAEDVERIDDRLDHLEERVANLEGISDAMDGYVDNIRSVNESVEQQAGAAYAAVDRLEERVDELEHAVESGNENAAREATPAEGPRGDSDPGRTAAVDGTPGAVDRHSNVERTVDEIVADSDEGTAGENGDGWVSKLTGGVLGGEAGPDEGATNGHHSPAREGHFDGESSEGTDATENDRRTAVTEADHDDVSRNLSPVENEAGDGTKQQSNDDEESTDDGFLSSIFS